MQIYGLLSLLKAFKAVRPHLPCLECVEAEPVLVRTRMQPCSRSFCLDHRIASAVPSAFAAVVVAVAGMQRDVRECAVRCNAAMQCSADSGARSHE